MSSTLESPEQQAYASVSGTPFGNALMQILMCQDIQPGSEPSYEMCKLIYLYHPLGTRLVDDPIILAQSQERLITVADSPGARVKEAFEAKWTELDLDNYIFSTVSTSRIYGIGSLVVGGVDNSGKKIPTNEPIDPWALAGLKLYFSVADPLNTAGSLVLEQDPNAPDFQKTTNIAVNGVPYHPSRTMTTMNERPIYIAYTGSAFGFVGRSVYQRCLYPLQSFLLSMKTDNMIVKKAGLLVIMAQQAGSITSNIMAKMGAVKRQWLKWGQTEDVLEVGQQDKVETLNMTNIDGAFGMARKNILENIASSAPMPAVMLNGETFAEGFGEGTEDAKKVAHYINRIRMQMQKIYAFCDRICMHCAWTEDFYAAIQADFPQYEGVDYKTAFMQWKNSFKAEWPSLLIEPESERAKSDDVKLKAVIAMLQVLLPEMDPENKTRIIEWALENVNDLELLFTTPAILDYDTLEEFMASRPSLGDNLKEPAPPAPESGHA